MQREHIHFSFNDNTILVAHNTINIVEQVTVTAPDQSKANTLTFNNAQPAIGGRDGDSVDELRQNSLRAYSEQNRTVTLQDYAIRSLALPALYGSISKVYVTQDQSTNANVLGGAYDSNPLALSLYVLAYNSEKQVVPATANLKENLKTYLNYYRILTDAINIKDAFIINIGVEFEISVLSNYNSNEVLLKCIDTLKIYFDPDVWQINQPIVKSDIMNVLANVQGVQNIINIQITNLFDTTLNYSGNIYDIDTATKNGVIYPSLDPSIFEIKFPNQDIRGRVVSY